MTHKTENFSRYLPTDRQAKKWGWRLIHAGRQIISPHSEYPDQGHPINYFFDTNGRRTLDEFQVVFIAQGSGNFESRSCPETKVQAGQALLLFPGEWHRYQPNQKTGWCEYWVGFRGREATRIMENFFSVKEPIYTVSQSDPLVQHFDQTLLWLRQPIAGKEQILASHLPMILAFIKSGTLSENTLQNKDSELVMQAKSIMLANLESQTNLETLAAALGVSYSQFRFAFKRQTGFSPRKFQNMIKLNRACDLLLQGQKSVSETADALGYSTVYYFSRSFKKEFGLSPQEWLKKTIYHKQQACSSD